MVINMKQKYIALNVCVYFVKHTNPTIEGDDFSYANNPKIVNVRIEDKVKLLNKIPEKNSKFKIKPIPFDVNVGEYLYIFWYFSENGNYNIIDFFKSPQKALDASIFFQEELKASGNCFQYINENNEIVKYFLRDAYNYSHKNIFVKKVLVAKSFDKRNDNDR